MHQELPFAFTETPRLTWLNYRWFLTTRCTVSEKTSAVLYWRHSQQTTAAFRSWQLPVPSPHHPILSRGNRLSPSGVFCNKHPSKTGFSSAFFKHFYITVSYRASYFKALMLTRKLAKLQAASDHVGIVWRWHSAGQDIPSVVGIAVTGSNPLLQKSCSSAPPFPFWTLQATKT